MKAKWLWTTWAYLAVAGVLVMELFFILFSKIYLLPKIQKIRSDGILTFDDTTWPAISWLFSFLDRLQWVCERLGWWLLLLTAVLWGLFESARTQREQAVHAVGGLGTAAIGLMVVVVLTAGSLELPFMVGLPPIVRQQHQLKRGDGSTALTSRLALEQALAKGDWEEMLKQHDRVAEALAELESTTRPWQRLDSRSNQRGQNCWRM